jgi:hypothetical protein
MLLAHMQKPPAPINVLHPELQVPEDVAALALRLLEKNRDMRPASARALIQEIEKIETDLLNPVKTRFVRTEDFARAADNRGALDDGLGATGGTESVRPQPPVPPAPKPPSPPPVRPQPQPPPPVRPQPQPQPPIPVVTPPGQRPRAPESRWGMWAALIVLLVGMGVGGLYIFTRPSHLQEPEPVPVTPANPAPSSAPEPTPPAPEPAPTPAPGPQPTPRPVPPTPKPRPTGQEGQIVDKKAVQGKISLGNFRYGRGEWDDAIAAYEDGLKLDPTNAELRQKLEQTIKICRAENATLNEGLKCGAP